MTQIDLNTTTPQEPTRVFPKIDGFIDGKLQITCANDFSFGELMGMKTEGAAKGVLLSALNALGVTCWARCGSNQYYQ